MTIKIVFEKTGNSRRHSYFFSQIVKTLQVIEKISQIEMFRFWKLLNLLSFFSIVLSENPPNTALIFDPFTWEIIDRQNPKEYNGYVAACPVHNEDEKFLNDNSSFDNNALFVRHYDENYDNVKDKDCDKNVKMSVIHYDMKGKQFIGLGYEVYYNESSFNHWINLSEYAKFSNIRKPISKSKIFWKKRNSGSSNPIVIPSNDSTKQEPRHDNLGFIWVGILWVAFNHSSWSTTYLTYEVDGNSSKLRENCDSDTLSHIYHNKKMPIENYAAELEKLYSPGNQQNLLQDVKLPNTLREDCRVRHNCLKKYNLAPYQLKSSSGKNSCSDLTSVPIWYELNESLLDYLNKFLTVIAQVTNGRILVDEGVHGLATLPLKKKGERAIYLDPKKKILPVPNLIYKVVTYETYGCKIRERLCWFGVIIVIHNEPNDPKIDPVCSQDTCKSWGWDSIKYGSTTRTSGTKSDYIYCCPIRGDLSKNFNHKFDKTILVGDLKLNNFPIYDGKFRQHLYKDRREEFEREMKKLLESQKSET